MEMPKAASLSQNPIIIGIRFVEGMSFSGDNGRGEFLLESLVGMNGDAGNI